MGGNRLIEVELYVSDPERSADLYRRVFSVPLNGHQHEEGGSFHYHASWGGWGDDPAAQGFLLFSLFPAPAGEVSHSAIGFAVDELDAVHRRAEEAGLEVVQPVLERPWGRSAAYRDHDGNLVSLTEPPR